MTTCSRSTIPHRKYCASDLDKEIKILDRAIVPPQYGLVDYEIEFNTDNVDYTWAGCKTIRGRTDFDGTGMEKKITHVWVIYYDAEVTDQNVVLFEGRLFDIIRVEDLNEQHEWMELSCSERGTENNRANYG